MSKKEITIEDLAEKMDAGFADTDRKFEESARLTQTSLSEMEQNLKNILADSRRFMIHLFDEADKKTSKRFDDIDQQLSSIRVGIKQIWEKIKDLESSIETVSVRTMEDDNLLFKLVDKIKRKEALGNN